MTTFTVTGKLWVSLNGSHRNPHAHQALMRGWFDRAVVAIRDQHAAAVEPPVVITATVRRTRNARQDAHNVLPTIKACIDAAVRCELIPDDDDSVVRALVIQAGPKASVPTVEIAIEHQGESA